MVDFDNLNDSELVVLAKTGNRTAFGKLVERYIAGVYNFCYRLTGKTVDAKDLTQDVFINAMQSICRFRQEAGLSTWFNRIAVNLWINKTKRRDKVKFFSFERQAENEEGYVLKNQFVDPQPDPETGVQNKELELVIQNAINSLIPEQRVAVVLKYIEGKSLDEIARLCKCSVGTVGSRLARGLKELREQLKPYLK